MVCCPTRATIVSKAAGLSHQPCQTEARPRARACPAPRILRRHVALRLKAAIAMSVRSVSAAAIDETAEEQHELQAVRAVRTVLPCVYCRADISADDFEFWTAAHRLLSATCPHCQRRVTLTAVTWRRWARPASDPVPGGQR